MIVTQPVTARNMMVPFSRLVRLPPEMDTLQAVRLLLKHRISGAPVVGDQGEYLGVFSEKTSMQFLIRLTYDALPSNTVEHFMNTESERTVSESTDLLSIVEKFLTTPYRRLPVVENGQLLGQLSRRDVLSAATKLLDRDQHDYRREIPWSFQSGAVTPRTPK